MTRLHSKVISKKVTIKIEKLVLGNLIIKLINFLLKSLSGQIETRSGAKLNKLLEYEIYLIIYLKRFHQFLDFFKKIYSLKTFLKFHYKDWKNSRPQLIAPRRT